MVIRKFINLGVPIISIVSIVSIVSKDPYVSISLIARRLHPRVSRVHKGALRVFTAGAVRDVFQMPEEEDYADGE